MVSKKSKKINDSDSDSDSDSDVKIKTKKTKSKKKGKINIKNSNKVIVNINTSKTKSKKKTTASHQQLTMKNNQLPNPNHSYIVSAPDKNNFSDNMRLKSELLRVQNELINTKNKKSSSSSSTNTDDLDEAILKNDGTSRNVLSNISDGFSTVGKGIISVGSSAVGAIGSKMLDPDVVNTAGNIAFGAADLMFPSNHKKKKVFKFKEPEETKTELIPEPVITETNLESVIPMKKVDDDDDDDEQNVSFDDFGDLSDAEVDDRSIGLFAVGGGNVPQPVVEATPSKIFTAKDKVPSRIRSIMGVKRNSTGFKEFLRQNGLNYDDVYTDIKNMPNDDAIRYIHDLVNRTDEPEEINPPKEDIVVNPLDAITPTKMSDVIKQLKHK